MAIVLLGARLLLAGVFAVAAVGKGTDRLGSRQALLDFGLPPALARVGVPLLPLVELGVALALLPRPTAWWGALGALGLLLLFSAAIGYNLLQGRTPDCHCFGQLHSKPIGWPTLVRNGVLAVPALLILGVGRTDPGVSAVAWLGGLTTAERIGLFLAAAAFALLAAEGWLLFHTLRQNGRLLLRIEALEARLTGGSAALPAPVPGVGLPLGTPAPSFSLSSLQGDTLTLEALRAAGKPVVLAFVDPDCGPCTALLPDLARWQHDYMGKLTLVLVSRGTLEANRGKTAEHGITHVLVQKDREVSQAYQAYGTPSAVVVHPDGTVGSGLAQGAEQIKSLVAVTVGLPALAPLPLVTALNGNGNGGVSPSRPGAPQVGDPAPPLSLPDLAGMTVNLADFHGQQTAVLFWNPSCGFCQRMLNDLKAWEASPPKGSPKLLVVSTGSVEANQAHGLQSPIVLDQSFATGQAFGSSGTPSAILVNQDGKIASDVSVGAPGVLAMLGVVETTR